MGSHLAQYIGTGLLSLLGLSATLANHCGVQVVEQTPLEQLISHSSDQTHKPQSVAKKNGLTDSRIKEVVTKNHYRVTYSSVVDLSEAKVFVFGDVHGYSTECIGKIVANLASPQDDILVEQPNDMKPFSFSNELFRKEAEKRFANGFVQGTYASALLSHLNAARKGDFFGVDAGEEFRGKYLEHMIQKNFLYYAQFRMYHKQKMHPFVDWMIFDDLGLGVRNATPFEHYALVKQEAECKEQQDEKLEYQRQSKIVTNSLSRVKSSKDTCFLVLGVNHVVDHKPSLLKEFYRKGLAYACFLPDKNYVEQVIKEKNQKPNVDTPSKDLANQKLAEAKYMVTLLKGYLNQRNKVQKDNPDYTPYTGTFDGLAEDFAKFSQGK